MNPRMPTNLTGKMAEAWDALFARADANGVVTFPATEVMPDLELLSAVGGCSAVETLPDGSKKVTLTFTDAPAEVPTPNASETVAASKKTEFAAGEVRREEQRR